MFFAVQRQIALTHSFLSRCRGAGFKTNSSGATAVEFGLVALPFMLMVMLVIGVGCFFFAVNSLDKGIADATRSVLTGTAQSSNMTVGTFRNLVCTQANFSGNNIDCSKLSVLMVSSQIGWADLQTKMAAQSCTSAGNLSASTGNSSDLLSTYSGTQGAYVLMTLCYQWEVSRYLPIFNTGTMSDGATLLQSSMAFQVEPYS